jgi:amino acid permease
MAQADEAQVLGSTKSAAYGATVGADAAPPIHGGNSAFLTAGIIVADVVGAGILSMAVAVKLMGWAMGAVAIVVLLAMNVHISILLWRVHMRHPQARTFMELTSAVCASMPEGTRACVVGLVGAAQSSFLFLVLGLYSLSIGEGLGKLFYETQLCLPLWTLIGSLVLLPVHVNATSLGSYKSLIYVNCSTILGSIFVPLIYMSTLGVEVTRPPTAGFYAVNPNLSFSDAVRGVSIFAFAFTGQFILVEIISEMKDREEFPKAYTCLSAPFQCAAFMIVGLGGYYFKGDSVDGIIVDTIGFGPTFRLAAMCLLSHMLITYLIKGIVFCKGVHRSLEGDGADEKGNRAWAVWASIVGCTIALTWFTAQLVPFFNDLVDLLGASLTPFCCWIVPIGLYVSTVSSGGLKDRSIGLVEWAIIGVELLLSVVLMIAGTGITVAHIFEQWQSYGGPFECHCESLWNTCECSAMQPGMEYCGAEARAEALLSLELRRSSMFY